MLKRKLKGIQSSGLYLRTRSKCNFEMGSDGEALQVVTDAPENKVGRRGERGRLEGDEEAGLVAVWGENPHMQREQIAMQRPWGRRCCHIP